MSRIDKKFKNRVYRIVSQIPQGRVMTYGQIASLCGAAWAAWEVGQIAHFGPENLPWQRVVNKNGFLANGYPGGKVNHKIMLEAEGVIVNDNYQVNIKELLWQPETTQNYP
jgi:methylated-DNA-protein-cysteine methyltransferase-like protein